MHPRVEKQAALGRRRLIHTYLTRRRCGQVKTNRTCRSSFQSSSSHVKLKIACSNTGQSDNQFPGRRNIFFSCYYINQRTRQPYMEPCISALVITVSFSSPPVVQPIPHMRLLSSGMSKWTNIIHYSISFEL